MGVISVSTLVPWLIFNINTVSSTSEIESSPISLAASDSLQLRSKVSIFKKKRKKHFI